MKIISSRAIHQRDRGSLLQYHACPLAWTLVIMGHQFSGCDWEEVTATMRKKCAPGTLQTRLSPTKVASIYHAPLSLSAKRLFSLHDVGVWAMVWRLYFAESQRWETIFVTAGFSFRNCSGALHISWQDGSSNTWLAFSTDPTKDPIYRYDLKKM